MSWTRAIKSHWPFFLFSLAVYITGFGLGIGIAYNKKATIHPQKMAFVPTSIHNLEVVLVLVIGGILTFGIFNTLFLGYNALMLGMTVKSVWDKYGAAPLVHGVLPHGLIEIAGTLILNTLGYESYRVLKALKTDATMDRKTVVHIREVLLLFSLGVVFIVGAAVIESTISQA